MQPSTHTVDMTHQDMDVEMVDALAGVGARVDDESEAVGGQALLLGHVLRHVHQVAVFDGEGGVSRRRGLVRIDH